MFGLSFCKKSHLRAQCRTRCSLKKYPIYHVSFPNQYLLTSTLLRFQEHYESPMFRGKIFGLEEFMDWYAADRGAFSYYTDWSGFNFPSRVLKPFLYGQFKDLTRKERAFIDLFDRVSGDFYVIATHSTPDPSFLAHECVHGLFHTNERYRKQVLAALAVYDIALFRRAIVDMGYHHAVVDDEANAYLMTFLTREMKGKNVLEVKHVSKDLVNIFRTSFGFEPTINAIVETVGSVIHKKRFKQPKG